MTKQMIVCLLILTGCTSANEIKAVPVSVNDTPEDLGFVPEASAKPLFTEQQQQVVMAIMKMDNDREIAKIQAQKQAVAYQQSIHCYSYNIGESIFTNCN